MIVVDCHQKKLFNHYTGSVYPVKLSKYGFSCLENSLMTPCGNHAVDACIGDGQPAGTLFRSREPIGPWDSSIKKGVITSRIIRLRGLDQGLNLGHDSQGRCVDTFDRYVYIHGVPEALYNLNDYGSEGCIILEDVKMIELFDEIKHLKTLSSEIHLLITWPQAVNQ